MKRPVVIGLLVAALLLVLAGIGAVVFFALRGADFAAFNVPLVSATAEESKTLKVDAKKPVSLKVNDDAGDISIVGADVETVEIQIVKTGYGSNDARAEEALKGIKYEVKQNGNTITFTYKLNGRQTREVNTVDLIITVPTETSVDLDNGFGVVDVSDLKGDVVTSGDFGDTTVANIEGALSLENSSGEIQVRNVDAGGDNVSIDVDFGKVIVEKLNGKDITVNSNSGTLDLSNIRATGDLFIKSDFGSITVENGSAASVTVESSSGKVNFTKFNVRNKLTVTADFGDIELNQTLADSYDLNSNSGGIVVDGVKGNLKAHTDFGSIDVLYAQNATLDLESNSGGIEFSGSLGEGPHSVRSDFGGITLSIPADSALNVSLETDLGSISSDIPLTVTLSGESDKKQQVGTMNGGGAELTVQTNNGSIEIKSIK